jgi:hypothetical protein
MLERYSHFRLAAKRDAMASVVLRPKAKEGSNSESVPVVDRSATVQ